MLRISSQQKFTHIKEFQIIENKKVGCGSFGTVKLARHRSTCRMYALKVIALQDMPSEAEIKLVQRQIRLHSELDHPHVIKLWDTILEGDSIYMVMEYAEQGNLFSYQNTKSVFSQTQAFKFFTQTIHGLRYLHQQNIIHRDLKPENILLDALGNVKICDFGWCAEEIHAKRTTFCGTYQYMAPQMLFKSQYDYHVDIWALGVLLYEMLHGYAPFKGKTTAEVKEAMLKGSYQLASHLSQSVKDLIRAILQFHPERRLSLDNILKHPWIDEMDNFVNNYLTLENAILPKQIQKKIGDAPPPPITPMSRNNVKRRKNNSLNFEEAGHSININLEINNYSIVGKQTKNRNNYHSQEKQREVNDFYAFKEASDKRGSVKKGKMQGLKSSQIDPRKFDQEMNGLKMLEKIKASKASKASTKELNALQKKLNDHGSKKKNKLRKSEMEMHDRPQKHAIRFNTEANDQWCEAPKLKKAGGKSKLLASNKSAIRLHKHLKD